ncbi:hypothetical protein Q4Q94_17445 [Morganella morganii]|uniref:hypothetical protein n=1 Tax=Morganella morganii TaxID=582 RepID=UPI001330482C|nr:hypothetical protein [Morganella morganii]HEC1403487.1 hypothetical protein [Enterobacter hormaechei]EKW8498953.1 hypothetical protein [Morganella morganii]MBT0454808.1 hypothetical protein [Morganella morganii subsp. morganii]MBT0489016.1 hypothetical protein [Morganella morganii subsp. morganii]MBT0502564.1 hypothetical protein [Morganella morganii subsp. morganii]
MKDRIKFSDEMLAAVIDGRKTQTRRLIEPQPEVTEDSLRELGAWQDGYTLSEQVCAAWRHMGDDCPYGKAGDVIPFADKDGNIKGKIEIVDVWLQRVQDAGDNDFKAEGYPLERELTGGSADAFCWFRHLWDSVSKPEFNYQANPWVWVITFKQIQEG